MTKASVGFVPLLALLVPGFASGEGLFDKLKNDALRKIDQGVGSTVDEAVGKALEDPGAALEGGVPDVAARPLGIGGGDVEVLGIKLGMTPDEVESILRAKGGVSANGRTQPVNLRRSEGERGGVGFVNTITATSAIPVAQAGVTPTSLCQENREEWKVIFHAPPNENTVSRIERGSTRCPAPSTDRLREALLARYGPASAQLSLGLVWFWNGSGGLERAKPRGQITDHPCDQRRDPAASCRRVLRATWPSGGSRVELTFEDVWGTWEARQRSQKLAVDTYRAQQAEIQRSAPLPEF